MPGVGIGAGATAAGMMTPGMGAMNGMNQNNMSPAEVGKLNSITWSMLRVCT